MTLKTERKKGVRAGSGEQQVKQALALRKQAL
jgi:hypothetical protein